MIILHIFINAKYLKIIVCDTYIIKSVCLVSQVELEAAYSNHNNYESSTKMLKKLVFEKY